VVLGLIAAPPASAHHKQSGPSIETIASGLNNPRHLAVDGHGDVRVAEAGRGPAPGTTSKSCFDSAEGPACTGATGALTRVSEHRAAGGSTPQQVALRAGTLTELGGIAVAGRKTLVVSNHGREAGKGEVLEIGLG
jgi:hypothetical protein